MKDKHVLITGATNGIGKVAALELAKMGAALTIVGRDKEKTHRVSGEIKTLSGNREHRSAHRRSLIPGASPPHRRRVSQQTSATRCPAE